MLLDIASVASVTRGPAWVPSFCFRLDSRRCQLAARASGPRRRRWNDAPFEHLADAALQSGGTEWLLEERYAGADVGLLQRLLGISGDVEHLHAWALAGDLLYEVASADAGHDHVGDEQLDGPVV